MAAAVVQTKVSASVVSLSSTPTNLAFDAPVTGGNAVVVIVAVGSTASTIAASDATNGTYDVTVSADDGAEMSATRSKRNLTGGFSTVSVTSSVTGNGVVFMFEVSGLDTGAAPSTGSIENGSGSTSHVSSASGLSGTGFSVCGAMLNTIVATEGTGWTPLASPSTARFCQYRTGTVSNNDGPFTTASGTGSIAVMAVFAEAAGVGGGSKPPRSRSTLGVG